MNLFCKAFRAELKRIKRWWSYAAILLFLPALSLLFFTLYFSNNRIESLPITVVDNDNTPISRELVEMISATQSVSICYKADNTIEAEALIRSGDAYAAVIIPRNFECDILRSQTTGVALYNSGINISTAGFIAKDISAVVATFGAAIELKRGKSLSQIMPIKVAEHNLFNPYINYGYYLAPCFMPMMLMIFTMLATITAITNPKPKSGVEMLGRVAPTTISMTIYGLIMLVLLFRVVGVPMAGSSCIIAITTILLILVYQAIAIFFVAVFKQRHTALSFGGGYAVLSFTLSGLTFPTSAMFPIFKVASYLFPFTYYIEIMVDQALRGASAEVSLPKVAIVSLFLLLPICKRL